MKFSLYPQLQNVHFSPFQCHSHPFLWIPVPFLQTPAYSSRMGSFLQESVGHDEVLLKTAKNHSLWSFCGLVWSFDFRGKGRPVMAMVKALWHQKTRLDWTFKHYQQPLTTNTAPTNDSKNNAATPHHHHQTTSVTATTRVWPQRPPAQQQQSLAPPPPAQQQQQPQQPQAWQPQ